MSIKRIHIAALSGSLRKGSHNTALLRWLSRHAPEQVSIEIIDIASVPLYNADVEAQGFPEAVMQVHQRLKDADAILLASPEYNYSVTGVLKNTIDWLSRIKGPAFKRKPLAILGATPGALATARSQMHLRQILLYLDPDIVQVPEVLIARVGQVLNETGDVVDDKTADVLLRLLNALLSKVESAA